MSTLRAVLGHALRGEDDDAPVAARTRRDRIVEHQPDVVLMDIRMPGMDGLAATEIVRGHDRSPEVIVLTTSGGNRKPAKT